MTESVVKVFEVFAKQQANHELRVANILNEEDTSSDTSEQIE